MGPRGLQDLQGLLQVLHHDPFSDGRAWSHCVSTPYLSGEPDSSASSAAGSACQKRFCQMCSKRWHCSTVHLNLQCTPTIYEAHPEASFA